MCKVTNEPSYINSVPGSKVTETRKYLDQPKNKDQKKTCFCNFLIFRNFILYKKEGDDKSLAQNNASINSQNLLNLLIDPVWLMNF